MINRARGIHKLLIKKSGFDPEKREDILKILSSDELNGLHGHAAAVSGEICSKEDAQILMRHLSSGDPEIRKYSFASVAELLGIDGQDLYMAKMKDKHWHDRTVVLFAIYKYGNDTFIEVTYNYLIYVLQQRPEDITYIEELSDILCVLKYLKKVSEKAYFDKAIKLMSDNKDVIRRRELIWIRDNLNIDLLK